MDEGVYCTWCVPIGNKEESLIGINSVSMFDIDIENLSLIDSIK